MSHRAEHLAKLAADMGDFPAEEARKIFGGFSTPAKMPCKTFSLPTFKTCPVGNSLRNVSGTVCSICYAGRRYYRWRNAIISRERRLRLVQNAISGGDKASAKWVAAIATSIKRLKDSRYFRWHDSGDIFCPEYADMIEAVCLLTPDTKHWIPTKEPKMALRDWPENVTVRFSLSLVDQERGGVVFPVFSVVVTSPEKAERFNAHLCAATFTDNHKCGDCRMCWDKDVRCVAYKKHL